LFEEYENIIFDIWDSENSKSLKKYHSPKSIIAGKEDLLLE
jgi:hypothetical protein